MAAVTSSGTAKVTLPTDTQILITRDFAAPAHLLYKAYTTLESGMEDGMQDAMDLLEEVAVSLA